MNEKTMNRPLSEAERALVERYHSLIYRVIGDLHLGADAAADLYGDAALGLVFAAQQYLTEERLQKYRFPMLRTAVSATPCCASGTRRAKRP